MNTFEDDLLIVPEIANIVMPGYKKDRDLMSVIDKDMKESRLYLRSVFEKEGWICHHHPGDGSLSIRVVDGSSVVTQMGEFSVLMALAVNVSVYGETPPRFYYERLFAPNSESFGAASSPLMAAVEAIALADFNSDGYTLYDGSLLGLNMNLGNLFRTQDSSGGFLRDVTEYSNKLTDLFEEVATPGMCQSNGNYLGPTIYSSIFNKERVDLFAISKKSTSTYAFNRVKEYVAKQDKKPELAESFFKVPKSDRLLLGQVLNPGEYIGPIPFKKVELKSGEKGLFGLADPATVGSRKCNSEISTEFLNNFWFLYFKPAPHTPVLRVEIVASRNTIEEKTQKLLDIVRHQCANPGIVEPYALWAADKLAKQIQPFKNIYGSANAIDYPDLFKPNRTEDIRR